MAIVKLDSLTEIIDDRAFVSLNISGKVNVAGNLYLLQRDSADIAKYDPLNFHGGLLLHFPLGLIVFLCLQGEEKETIEYDKRCNNY